MNIFRRMKSEQKTFERYIKNKEEPCVAVVRKSHLLDDYCFPSFLSRDIMAVIISEVGDKNVMNLNSYPSIERINLS